MVSTWLRQKMACNFSYASIIILLFLLLIFARSPSLFSHATDTLKHGQSISDGEALRSAGDIFELGFFSPGISKYRYVGIWHQNMSEHSVVWVANREVPLRNSSGNLTVGSDGNLLVLGGGSVVWSSNLSVAANNATAQLLDSGNLVLRTGDGTVVWESFDHPTDTFLPGMKISYNTKSGKRVLFTSWKSPDDPSAGNYSLSLDPFGSAQVFMWEGTVPRWRSGQWNGQVFIGTTMRALYIYGFKYRNDVNQGIMYYTYAQCNSSVLRFVLQWDGVENATMQVGDTNGWESVWAEPVNECQIYGKCGSYGKCNDGDTPICSCLEGFEPSSSLEWSKGNWSGGCVRRTLLECQVNSSSGDGFFRLAGVKLPDLSDWASTVLYEADCERACLKNCSCKAYAFVSGIGCMIWVHDLIDIYQYPEGDNDLYIKLAGSELGTNSKSWRVMVTASTMGGFILITCIFLGWKCQTRIKNWLKKGRKKEDLLHNVFRNREIRPDLSGPSKYGEEVQEGEGAALSLFTFECISIATSNFSDTNKLGEGGFGHVYKGMLPEGQEIAVKRLSKSSVQGLEELKVEVMLIAKLQHRNLVKLLGCCIEGEEKILIYEYMPNGSLDAFLFHPTKKALLDWRTRFNIIDGIARGLLYLHRDSRLRIVHRDLKASNILLDENMNPKISDFGMAKIFRDDQNQANTNRIVGTFGYMSPEYAMVGTFSVKSDVYSFGILVLEIVTGQRNHAFHQTENSMSIVGHAWHLWNEDKAVELIDPSIQSKCSVRQAMRCIHVGLLCVQDRASERPDMPSIILMMAGETTTLPMPKQPTYTSEGSLHGRQKM